MSTDEAIQVRRAQAGDVEAFEALVRPYEASLLRLVYSMTGDREDAEDALQETLLRAYTALPRFRGDATFSTWLYRVALNTTRNWIRSESRASSQQLASQFIRIGASHEPDPGADLLKQERRSIVRAAVMKLPPHYRDVTILRHYHDLPYEQIAEIQNVPVGTVRSRLAQARKLLLQSLQGSGYFDHS